MLRSFRYLLFPFSLIYGAAVWMRNRLFDKNILKSSGFNFPIICVGNLAAGGTGKTPMTEYLLRFLKKDFKTATLSRGYKRKTTGFAIANEQTTALEIGDEPMQFHQKFPDVVVAVGEERLVAIPQLLHERPETEVIILDDAFQHRQVQAGLNILLTDYSDLYTRDLMLPAGNLRDVRSSSARADIIVVTKCPAAITKEEKRKIIDEIDPTDQQQVFFTTIVYGKPYHLFDRQELELAQDFAVLLVCGIANPAPLKTYLTDTVHTYDLLRYADHHIFHTNDLRDIKQQFEKLKAGKKIVLTTEKDAVRLEKFVAELRDFPIYVIPVEHAFLFAEEDAFRSRINAFIKSFRQ
ncbi:MAG TPA: tetraacyldisaccharide 4'-kinase [Ferruginibacter sp.]|nr:tetraacyldisaccharide 4'-kinase [Ferruginibacter sp.]HMX80412.1 tetraacyldisaccharide 4'-kinase [Ferruginibacter sp.]HNN71475.1 tetraacyldisaccharide 4'-kinase [Ferruginibacter sp.]